MPLRYNIEIRNPLKTSTYDQEIAEENVTEKSIIMKSLTGTIYKYKVTKKLESWKVIQMCWKQIIKLRF